MGLTRRQRLAFRYFAPIVRRAIPELPTFAMDKVEQLAKGIAADTGLGRAIHDDAAVRAGTGRSRGWPVGPARNGEPTERETGSRHGGTVLDRGAHDGAGHRLEGDVGRGELGDG